MITNVQALVSPVSIAVTNRGPSGAAATIAIGDVVTVEPDDPAAVSNSGTPTHAVLDFEIPKGDKGDGATVVVGSVTTLAAGSNATAENVGTPGDAVINFGIPRGDPGDAATIEIGDVTTVPAGTPASVTNVGDSQNALFDFEIPQGEATTIAIGVVTTGAAGSPATITNVGTATDLILNFSIPRGEDGIDAAIDAPSFASTVHGGAEKITIDDNDEFGGSDSQAGWVFKRWKWSTLKGLLASVAVAFGADNRLLRSDGTGRGVQATGLTVDDSDRLIAGHTASVPIGAASGTHPKVQVHGLDDAAHIDVARWSNNANPAMVSLVKSRGATPGTHAIVNSGDAVALFQGNADDGANYPPAAAIRIDVDGAPGAGDMPGRIVFLTTADGAAVLSERMRVDRNGNVGIGTVNPGEKLVVAGNAWIDGSLTIDGGKAAETKFQQIASAAASGAVFTVTSGIAGKREIVIVVDGVSHDNGSNQALQMAFSPDGTTWTAAGSISPSGGASGAIRGVIRLFLADGGATGAGTSYVPFLTPPAASAVSTSNGYHVAFALTAAMTGIRLNWSAGNFDGGTITVYAR